VNSRTIVPEQPPGGDAVSTTTLKADPNSLEPDPALRTPAWCQLRGRASEPSAGFVDQNHDRDPQRTAHLMTSSGRLGFTGHLRPIFPCTTFVFLCFVSLVPRLDTTLGAIRAHETMRTMRPEQRLRTAEDDSDRSSRLSV
jgi:hypothetical protein